MPKRPTHHVRQVKRELALRLRDGHHRPGERFLSNRAVAERYGVSYQTAHRVLGELVAEGLLERRARSGSYVPGAPEGYAGCALIVDARAGRAASFGARLLEELRAALHARGLDAEVVFADGSDAPQPAEDRFPIVWEVPESVEALARARRFGLIVAQEPPPGLASLYLDSVSADDFSGGSAAAQILQGQGARAERVCIVGGPPDDPRSAERVRGFRSILPGARLVFACGWRRVAGEAVAGQALAAGPDGVFCCNDRLAEAVERHMRELGGRRPLIGFDDAPVAAELGLDTIAMPWEAIAAATAEVARTRIAGHAERPRRQIFAPRPRLRRLAMDAI